jgi:hypothetical protein
VRAVRDLLMLVDEDEVAGAAHAFFMVALVNVGAVCDLLLAV